MMPNLGVNSRPFVATMGGTNVERGHCLRPRSCEIFSVQPWQHFLARLCPWDPARQESTWKVLHQGLHESLLGLLAYISRCLVGILMTRVP